MSKINKKESSNLNIDFMREAIKEAGIAYELDEVPVGCVIVKDDKIIARAHNMKESMKSAIYHAEVIAIDEASKKLDDFRLNECTMFVTLEPCPMCASLINQSRLKKVIVGCYEHESGSFGSVINFKDHPSLNYHINVEFDLRDEIKDMMQSFFLRRRNKTKEK